MLRPPIEVMTASPIAALPQEKTCPGGCRFEVKWDGFRAIMYLTPGGPLLRSRAGRRLDTYFPDVRRSARTLPDGLVIDGELVAWSPQGRTDFTALQRRITAGRGLPALASRFPAYLIAFDLLGTADQDLRGLPLRDRRAQLEDALSATADRVVLCPQTQDRAEAIAWMTTMLPLGVEGLVIKAADSRYRPGRSRGAWRKWRSRHTSEAIVGGITGRRSRPDTLLLGRYNAAGQLRVVGRTVPITETQAAELSQLLARPGAGHQNLTHPWPQPLPEGWLGRWGDQSHHPLRYVPVEPDVVVEVSTDDRYESGRWRHPCRLIRPRLDLSPYDVPPHRRDEA